MTWIAVLLLVSGTASSSEPRFDSRGVTPLASNAAAVHEAFEPSQSAALFVGVRRFPYDPNLAEVRYAVDDAVDLAALLALDEQVRLVDPPRVILALSGEPQKPDSRRNLERLVAAGARVRSAAGPDVLNALDEQSHIAGKKGMLIFAFATHGYAREGTQYLLSATSILRHAEGVISEDEIRDIASESDAARSLIVIDACRERLTEGRRSIKPDARSAAALLRAMDGVHGQVVLSAAAAGQYAYDDDERRNGVFTAALIDGLRCYATADARGLITVDSLSSFIEQRVLAWIRNHRNSRITHATQVSFEGIAKTMPLATCHRMASAGTIPTSTVAAVLDAGTARANRPSATGIEAVPVSSNDASVSITVIALDDRGEPSAQLVAAANDAIRESGYHPVSISRSTASDPRALQQLAAGRAELLEGMHLSNVCRAVFAGTVVRLAVTESDAPVKGVITTHLRLRFFLIDAGVGTVLSSIDSDARGGGFSRESSELQAWERAAAILRTEMRRMKWTELLAVR